MNTRYLYRNVKDIHLKHTSPKNIAERTTEKNGSIALIV